MTSSGVTSGSSMSVLTEPLPHPRQRWRPSASATPSGTVTRTQMSARISVCSRALVYSGLCATLPVGSPVNQRIEKPCQVVRERPSLKAKSTAMATGMIDQMMYAPVRSGRKRGWPQGLRSQLIRGSPPGAARRVVRR